MDRNFDTMQIVIVVVVALRKESVDRNLKRKEREKHGRRSLSARRAWIEIVAMVPAEQRPTKSLSARRAWIEIDPVTDKAWALEGRSPQGERG